MKSTEKLLIELEKLSNSIMKDALIKKAKEFKYHDYKSPDAMPITNLVNDLKRFYEHTKDKTVLELIEKAKNGEFDATKEESDEWAHSTEGRETMGFLKNI